MVRGRCGRIFFLVEPTGNNMYLFHWKIIVGIDLFLYRLRNSKYGRTTAHYLRQQALKIIVLEPVLGGESQRDEIKDCYNLISTPNYSVMCWRIDKPLHLRESFPQIKNALKGRPARSPDYNIFRGLNMALRAGDILRRNNRAGKVSLEKTRAMLRVYAYSRRRTAEH